MTPIPQSAPPSIPHAAPTAAGLEALVLFDTVTVDARTYTLLLPVDPRTDRLDAVVLRVDTSSDGAESLVALEDEAEWRRAVAAFTALLAPRRPRLVRKAVSTSPVHGALRGSASPARRLPRPHRVRV